MDWQECKDKKFIKEVGIDENLINSLIKSSENKLKTAQRLELDETSSSTKISIIYKALREILEALAIKNNFKIYNHECFCAFLNEILKNNLACNEFNRFRKIRNKINYYGKQIPINEAKIIIKEMIILRKTMINKYLS